MTPPAASLDDVFDAVARRQPDRVAVVDDRVAYTYREVDALAGRVADGLLARGAGGTRVGLALSRSHLVPIAVLGVLRAGCSYVPLDPTYPEARLRFMAGDSDVSLVIADDAAPPLGRPVATVEELAAASRGTGTRPAVSPASEAYVIYTSGSTGQPKGVRVSHGNVLSLLAATDPLFAFTPDDCWALFHSYSFDFSVWEMWGAYRSGGRLIVVPAEATVVADRLLDLLVRHQVTVLNQVPSVFDHLVRSCVGGGRSPAPRYVIFGGERLRPASVRRWFELPQRAGHEVVNMYGITETTVHVTHRRICPEDVREDDATSPIGRPLGHVDVHILDEEGQPTAGPGEIWVTGPGVALGYLGREDLERERFRELDVLGGARAYRSGDRGIWLDDELGYLGRVDDQVKVRGYRIELGEVEAVLRHHPAVDDAIVVAAPLARGELGLVALVTSPPGTARDAGELRQHLASRLPRHMVPNHVFEVPGLPRLPSGKPDRSSALRMAETCFADRRGPARREAGAQSPTGSPPTATRY